MIIKMILRQMNKEFWDQRYADNDLGWDIGAISTPIKEYIDQLSNKKLKILIPGAGNGYEAEYLFKQGFSNVYVLDISKRPLQNLSKRLPSFPKNQLLLLDFFELNDSFDLIIEQTFFCALDPNLRNSYCKKMQNLLKADGKLIGLLFNKVFSHDGPPFGGTLKAYKEIFREYFTINKLQIAYNSIKPRQGSELFFIFTKKRQ
jgi:thiopurine S-methyltransferase